MKKQHIAPLLSILILIGIVSTLVSFGISDGVSITFNGEEIDHPLIKAFGGIFGILVAVIAVTFALLITVLVLSGVGVIVFGTFVFVGLILIGVALPFLLPVIIPLCIVLFVYMLKPKANKRLESNG